MLRPSSNGATTVSVRGLPKSKNVDDFNSLLRILGMPSPSRTGIQLENTCNRAVMEYTNPRDAEKASEKLLGACSPPVDASWLPDDWQVESNRYERVNDPRSVCLQEEPFADVNVPAIGTEELVEVRLNVDVVMQLGDEHAQWRLDQFGSTFAGWTTIDGQSRAYERTKILETIRKTDDAFQVLGFIEFPYVDVLADSVTRRTRRKVEREYWLLLNHAGRVPGAEDDLAILRVLYEGDWVEHSDSRDRSYVSQLLFRLSAGHAEQSLQSKLADTARWWGISNVEDRISVPNQGRWSWETEPELLLSVHKILVEGEKCSQVQTKLPLSISRGVGQGPCTGNTRKALILAMSKYHANSFSCLANAIRDGHLFESTLQHLGWEVHFKTDLGLKSAEEEVKQFAAEVANNVEACVFAFVGHGIEINGNSYLVPCDADIDPSQATTVQEAELIVRRSCLSFQHVIQHCFAKSRNGDFATIFVLDCCRNRFFDVIQPQRGRVGCEVQPLSTDIRNSCVIYSTTPGKTASDGEPGMGGPFMTAFTEEMAQEGRELESILRDVRRRMAKLKSSCQLAPTSSLLEDNFVFRPPQSMKQETDHAGAAVKEELHPRVHRKDAAGAGTAHAPQLSAPIGSNHDDVNAPLMLALPQENFKEEGSASFLSSGVFWSSWVNGKLVLLNNLVLRFEASKHSVSDFIGCFHIAKVDGLGREFCIELRSNQGYNRNCTLPGPRKLTRRVYAFNSESELEVWHTQLQACRARLAAMEADLEEQTKACGLTFMSPSASLSAAARLVEGSKYECDFLGATQVMHRASSYQAMYMNGPTVLQVSQPFSRELPYFEVFICDLGGDFTTPPAGVAVGFLNHDSLGVRFNAPGGAGNSLGYDGLDGSIVHRGQRRKGWGPTWRPGDRIGCGAWFDEQTNVLAAVYFTINGKLVNTAFSADLSIGSGDVVYPVVRLFRPWARVDLRPGLGQHPGSVAKNGLMISGSSPGI